MLFRAISAFFLSAALHAPAADLTLPPETARLAFIVEGRGVQMYTCTIDPAGAYSWKLTGPEADLYNLATGKREGHHSAGPTWTFDDGRVVQGTLLQSRATNAADNVPWLLLEAHGAPPAENNGALQASSAAKLRYIRRYNTQGGVAPPTGCDAQHPAAKVRVPYSAQYAFYFDTE